MTRVCDPAPGLDLWSVALDVGVAAAVTAASAGWFMHRRAAR
jgi:hypothetical protein